MQQEGYTTKKIVWSVIFPTLLMTYLDTAVTASSPHFWSLGLITPLGPALYIVLPGRGLISPRELVYILHPAVERGLGLAVPCPFFRVNIWDLAFSEST